MSTNSECLFVEPKPGEWYYILESYNAPKNAWDWREYADATGPFSSETAAQEYLSTHESNPGGSSTFSHSYFKPDAVYETLIRNAHAPKSGFSMYARRPWRP